MRAMQGERPRFLAISFLEVRTRFTPSGLDQMEIINQISLEIDDDREVRAAVQLTPTFIERTAHNLNLGMNAQLISRLLNNKGSQLNHLTLNVLSYDL